MSNQPIARARPSTSVAIGPANYAGQATEWANSLKSAGTDASSFGTGGVYNFPVDYDWPSNRSADYGADWGKALRSFFPNTSTFVLDGFVPVAPAKTPSEFLKGYGSVAEESRLILVSHGSDTRDPIRHAIGKSYSFFRRSPLSYSGKLVLVSARNRWVAKRLGVPLLVSTPDLLEDNPSASWVPLKCSESFLSSRHAPKPQRRVPRVLHVPSRTRPPIKGTDFINPAMRRLAHLGLIEAVLPTAVPHGEMRSLVESVDIVVDQIQTGSYGVAAIEAMALGRVVVGNVSNFVAEVVGQDLPIVSIGPAGFEEGLRELAANIELREAYASMGPNFVRTNHNGAKSADVFMKYTKEIPDS